MDTSRDTIYLNMLLKRIEVCKTYKPKFGLAGKEIGLSLERFQVLYESDVFYSWFGLDHPLVYAAHKAAGGMTSVYRQIGTGVEALVRQILRDEFQLTAEQVKWTYELKTGAGRKQVLSLDGRLAPVDIQVPEKQRLLADWLQQVARKLDVNTSLNGVVFEIRQGYKSRDSKRQNADIRFC